MAEYEEIRSNFIPDSWEQKEPLVVKYVDDVLGVEKIGTSVGKLHSTTRKQTSLVHAIGSEELINAITENAATLGLKVNASKTQMVCIYDSTNLYPPS